MEELPSDSSSPTPITRSAGDEKYDVLGYGYDVTGEYLHPLSVKNPVLDINRYEMDFKNRLVYGTSSWGYDQMYCGGSSLDYVKEVTNETKVDLNMNSASLETSSVKGEREKNRVIN